MKNGECLGRSENWAGSWEKSAVYRGKRMLADTNLGEGYGLEVVVERLVVLIEVKKGKGWTSSRNSPVSDVCTG